MKRILTVFLLVGLAFEAGAQTWYDALTFSENDYLGTARSVGMGNAMTAVGGDLGSITFNPAGAAVATYSQFTITPGVSIASVFGQGTYVGDSPYGFEDGIKTRSGRFQVPNFGAMVVYDTKNRSGLKRVTFGLVGNMTRDYNNRLRATGTNNETTLAGSFASLADGYAESVLKKDYFDDDIPSWNTLAGYKGGLIDPVPGRDGTYLGLTEMLLDNGDMRLSDRIRQYYGLNRSGNKYDLLMNFAMDFSDRFYVGANLGITTLTYSDVATIQEEAIPGGTYRDGFQSIRFDDVIEEEASGIYAKVGFIARPFAGLRIGAAVQTPTLLEFRETYGKAASSVASTNYSTDVEDLWYYNLKTPFRFNAGVAYTIGQVAMLSADYEMCDYSAMRFRPTYDSNADFSGVNQDIRDFAGASHMFRVGGELKPAPELALRVGYNYATSPEIGVEAGRQSVSFGLGYSSAGSFFADFAVRFQYLPDEFITPYYYYSWDDQGTFIDDNVLTPQVCSQASLCNALVTLGWRF